MCQGEVVSRAYDSASNPEAYIPPFDAYRLRGVDTVVRPPPVPVDKAAFASREQRAIEFARRLAQAMALDPQNELEPSMPGPTG